MPALNLVQAGSTTDSQCLRGGRGGRVELLQACLTVASNSSNRSIFSPRTLLSALRSAICLFMPALSSSVRWACLVLLALSSSLTLASLAWNSSLTSSMRWLSLASLALVSIRLTARKTPMAPHAVGGSHSATADGNDGNRITGAACFSLPTQTPWTPSPGVIPGPAGVPNLAAPARDARKDLGAMAGEGHGLASVRATETTATSPQAVQRLPWRPLQISRDGGCSKVQGVDMMDRDSWSEVYPYFPWPWSAGHCADPGGCRSFSRLHP